MSAQIIPVARYRIRFWIDINNDVRRVHEKSVVAKSPVEAIMRAIRDHAGELFGINRRGRVISCVQE